MAQAKQGDKVKINFTGRLEDGSVFDSTLEDECSTDQCDTEECSSDDCGCGCETGPMELVIGEGELFPQVEEALIGMAPGEKKTVMISAEEAFGLFDETKVFSVPVADLPEDFDAVEGDELILSGEDDEEIGVTVVEITDTEITFDANHPLAGQNLTFELDLLEIV
jgi:peptidylprolyl isomerase